MTSSRKILSGNGEPLISARKAAKRLSCAQDYVGKLCREGKLRGTRVGKAWFVEEESIKEFEIARELAKAERSEELSRVRKEESEAYRKATEVSYPPEYAGPVNERKFFAHLKNFGSTGAITMVGAVLLFSALAFAGERKEAATLASEQEDLAAALAHIDSPFFATPSISLSIPGISPSNFAKSLFSGFASLFKYNQNPPLASNPPVSNTPAVQTPAPPAASTSIPTIIQYTYPVIEKTVERIVASQGVSPDALVMILSEMHSSLRKEISRIVGGTIDNLDISRTTIIEQGGGGGSGSVTSVDISGGTTGLTASGGPITNSGTFTLGGVLEVLHGGTGVSSAPQFGELLMGNGVGGYDLVSTSSLGIAAGGNPSWGNIIGTLSDQTDLQNALDAKFSLVDWYATTTDALDEGSTNLYFTNTRVQTYLDTLSKGYFFSTTSASHFLEQNQSLAFSTTSAQYFLSQAGVTGGFSTTSADYWRSVTDLFSTTSAAFFLSQNQGNAFSTTSANNFINASSTIANAGGTAFGDTLIWNGSRWVGAATSSLGLPTNADLANYLTLASWYSTTTDALEEGLLNLYYSDARVQTYLDTIAKGYFFATSSADFWKSANNFFSTTSASYFLAQNQGNAFSTTSALTFLTENQGLAFSTTSASYFLAQNQSAAFSTTSVDFWKSVNNFFSSTSAQYFLSENQGLAFSTTSANNFINASSTIANAGGTAFGDMLLWNGSRWIATATSSLGISGNVDLSGYFVLADWYATTTDGLDEGLANLYYTDERVDDRVGSLLQAGSGVLLNYNDGAGTLTISATGGGGGGSDVNWSYFNGSGIRPATSTNQVLIGGTSTSTLAKLQVIGGAVIDSATTTDFFATNASTTNATTTNLFASNLTIGSLSGLLQATNGVVSAAQAGVDYESPLTFNYPITRSANAVSLAFGTTTANTWSSLQTLSSGFLSTASSTVVGGFTVSGTATTSSLAITGVTSSILQTNALGQVVPAVAGTDYATPSQVLNLKDWQIVNGYLTPTSTLGIIVSASSTIGSGTAAGGLTIAGNATTTGLLHVRGTGTSTIASNILVSGSIVPSVTNSYSLGTPDQVWEHIFIGPGSLYVNGQKVVSTDGSDNVIISSDPDENLVVETSGTANIEFNPTGSGQILLKGGVLISGGENITTSNSSALPVPFGVAAGNITVSGNAITATNLNGGISLTPSGSGGTYVTAGNFGIATTSPLAKLDIYGNAILSGVNRYLNFNSEVGSGGYGIRDNGGTLEFKNAAGNWTSLSSSLGAYLTLTDWYATTTDALDEGSANLYFTNARVQTYLDGVSKGYFFATSSADYWKTQNNFFSSTSAQYFIAQNQGAAFSTTSAQYFAHSSSTIPKTYTDNVFTGGNTFSTATTTNFSILGITDSLLKTNSLGQVIAAIPGTDYLTTGDIFEYPFPGNATSTLLSFTGGLLSTASTTIGNGTQAGGLTVFGGATTTGNLIVSGGNLALTASNSSISLMGGTSVAAVLSRNTSEVVTLSGPNNGSINLSAPGGVGVNDITPDYRFEINGTAENGYFGVSNTLDGDIFVINGSGDVGIGTTDPAARLDVLGTASSSNLFVAHTATSTNIALTSVTSSLLKTNALGQLIAAVPDVDYAAAGTLSATRDWQLINGALSPTTTLGIGVYASSTIGNGTNTGGLTVAGTATSTNSVITSLTNALLSTNASGRVVNTTVSSPLTYSNNTLGIQQSGAGQAGYLSSIDWNLFNQKISSTSLSGTSVISYTSGTGVITTQAGAFGGDSTSVYTFPGDLIVAGNSTTTNATSTNVYISGSFAGANLSTCNSAADKLVWANGQFGCATDAGSGGGLGEINWTYFNDSGVRVSTSTNQVLIGHTSTSTLSLLEVVGGATIDNATTTGFYNSGIAHFGGTVGIGTSSPVEKFTIAGGNILQTASGNPTLAAAPTTGGQTFSVYTAGRYAYVAANGAGVKIFDTSNPENPILVGSYTGITAAHAIVVAGKYAYVSDGNDGLVILDIASPSSPALMSATSIPTAGHSFTLAISGNYLFVPNNDGGNVKVIDVSNPVAPSIVATYTTNGSPYAIAVHGKYAFVGDQTTGDIFVHDISNPAAPVEVERYTGVTSPTSIYISGAYAYVTDAGDGLYVLDISDITTLAEAGVHPNLSGYYSVVVAGNYGYLADPGGAFEIVDVRNPAAMQTVGTVSLSDNPIGVFLSGKYAYVANSSNAFQIIDINGATFPAAHIGALESSVANIINTLTVGGDIYAGGGLNVGVSGIFSRGGLSVFGTTTLQNFTALSGTTTNATSTNFFATTASSTNLSASLAQFGQATSSRFAISTLTNALLATNATGGVIATTTISNTLLDRNDFFINGLNCTLGFSCSLSLNDINSSWYPFGGAGNSTSTLTQFNGGLTSFASTTIGGGTAISGLTISGGATTTGNAYFAGSVGIGISNPQNPLDIQSSSVSVLSRGIRTSATSGTGGAFSVLGVNDGAALADGDRIGGFLFQGTVDASNTTQGGGVIAFADGAWNPSSAPTRLVFQVMPSGSVATGDRLDALTIKNTGNVGIGNTNPLQKLNVQGVAAAHSYFATSTAQTSIFSGGLTVQGTTTLANATSSAFAITSILSSLLKTDGSGNVIPAIAGTDYVAGSSFFAYPFPGNATSTALDFTNGLTISGGTLTVGTLTGPLQAVNGAVSATSSISAAYIEDRFLRNDQDDTTTGSLTATRFVGSSASATSTLAGGLIVDTDSLVVDYSSGRVGLGTASPSARLEVSGNTLVNGKLGLNAIGSHDFTVRTSGSQPVIEMQKSDGTVTSQWGTTSGNDDLFFDAEVSGSDILFRTSGNTTRLTVDGSSGNIGIGTTTPYSRLTAWSSGSIFEAVNSASTTILKIGQNGATTTAFAITNVLSSLLKTDGSGNVIPAVAGIDYATTGTLNSFRDWHIINGALSPTTTLGIVVAASSTIGNGIQGLTINGAATTTGNAYFGGNVGIGEESPGSKLSVSGGATIGSGYDTTSAPSNGLLVQGVAGFGTSTPDQKLVVSSSGNTSITIDDYNGGSNDTNRLYFRTANDWANPSFISSSWWDQRMTFRAPRDTTNAGILFESNDGTDRLFINTSSGNLGVGTSTPNTRLTVTSGGVNGLNLDADTSASTRSARLFFSTATAGQANTIWNEGGDLAFAVGGTPGSTSGTRALTIQNSTGNVGIGTTSPYAKLSVVGEVAAAYFTATTTGINTFPNLIATTATSTNLAVTSVTSSLLKTNALGQLVAAVAGTDYLTSSDTFAYPFPGNATSTTLTFNGGLYATASSTFADIVNFPGGIWNASGNLGIGMTNPTHKLDVTGNARFTTGVRVGTGGSYEASLHVNMQDVPGIPQADSLLVLEDNSQNVALNLFTNSSYDSAIYFGDNGAADVGRIIYDHGADTLLLGANGSINQLFLTSNGNVGLGNTSPSQKLNVQGEVAAQNFTSTSTTAINTFPILTSTNATSSTLAITSIASSLLKTDASGNVIPAIAGTDYAHFGYPFPGNATSTALDFTNGLTVSGGTLTVGTLTGPLQAVNGAVSATSTLSVVYGGTGQTSFTNGQLLIGNTTTGGLSKAALTGTSNQITVTNGAGTITLSTPQNIHTSATPQFARLGLGQAADASIPLAAARNTAGATVVGVLRNTATAANNNGPLLEFTSNRTGTTNTSIARVGGLITDITAAAYKGALTFYTANNTTPAERMRIDYLGNVGVGTSTPYSRLTTWGTDSLFEAVNSASTTILSIGQSGATTTALAITTLQSTLLKTDASGNVIPAVAGTDYLTSANASPYPFSLTGNATSTLTQFNGGLTSFASTTIGGGTQTGGLTISGGATTTGNQYIAGTLDTGSSANIGGSLNVTGNGTITSSATTGRGFDVVGSSLTTGTLARFYSNSSNTSARNLVDIIQDNASASGAVALRIQQDSTADIVNVFDGSTEVFTILDGGNVGLGTTSPFAKLSVAGSAYIGGDLTATGTVAFTGLGSGFVGSNNGTLYSFASSSITAASSTLLSDNNTFSGNNTFTNPLTLSGTSGTTTIASGQGFTVGSSQFVVQQGSGNVGVGTSAPGNGIDLDTKLHVRGSGTTGQTRTALVVENTSSNAGSVIRAINNSGNYFQAAMYGSNYGAGLANKGLFSTSDGADMLLVAGGSVSTGSSNYLAFYAGGYDASQERMRVTATGNIGIGTSTPYSKLSVWGGGTGIGSIFELANSASTTLARFLDNGTGYFLGNIGIGTTSPYLPLAVSGSGVFENNVTASTFTATSTTATSTFAGGLNIGNGSILYDFSSGQTSIDNLALGALTFEADSGIVSLVDMPVTSNATGGTVMSYSAQIDGNALLTIYSESDGSGSIQNARVGIGTTSPYASLSVSGRGVFESDVFASHFIATSSVASQFPYASTTMITATTASTTNLILSALGSAAGQCLTTTATGEVTSQACSSGGLAFPFDTTSYGVSTSTLVGFTGGIMSLASSTIGNGTQAGGLTIAGGATTTGTAYFAGNVGVGTSSPAVTLEVVKNTNSSSDYARMELKNPNVSGHSFSQFAVSAANDAVRARLFVDGLGTSATVGTPGFVFGSQTNHPFFLISNNIPRMTIAADGNIGIGTSSPLSTLDVTGSGISSRNTGGAAVVRSDRTDGKIGALISGSNSVLLGYDSSGSFAIQGYGRSTLESTSFTSPSQFVIEGSSGNVGIGTTSPWAKLSVEANNLGASPAFAIGSSTRTDFVVSNAGQVGIGTTTFNAPFFALGQNVNAKNVIQADNADASFAFAGLRVTGAQQVANSNFNMGVLVDPALASNLTVSHLHGVMSGPANTGGTLSSQFSGIYSAPINSATSTSVYGAIMQPTNTLNGTSTNIYGVWSNPIQASTANVTNVYSFYSKPSVSSAATNVYGLYLDTPGNGTITNKFGVYQADANAQNYFAGNVGIGTTTPNFRLTAHDNSTFQLSLSNTDTGGRNYLLGSSDNGWGVGGGRFLIYDNTAFQARLAIDSAGNVGIGTTSPGSILSVQGVANFTTATSTMYGSGGLNISGGCYAVNNVCVGGGSGGVTGSGVAGRAAFWDGTGSLSSDATFLFDSTNDRLTVSNASTSVLSVTGGRLDFSATAATTTIINNSPFAFTIATSTFATPLFRIDTTSGAEMVTIGVPNSDVIIGDVGSVTNLVFEEDSTIKGQGAGRTITIGANGDEIIFGGAGTTTFSGNGINVTSGCIAINGECIGSDSGGGGIIINTVVLTSGSSATYNPTSGATSFEVWTTGQGGGGGGSDTDGSQFCGGGGGGGGGTAYRSFSAAEMGASATYTVGSSAGGGGTGNGGNGTAGSNSTFDPAGSGPTLTGNGGSGGTGTGSACNTNTSFAGGAGGSATASGGQVIAGQNGSSGSGMDNVAVTRGAGGNSFAGLGAAGETRTTSSNGTAASANSGGGGSGAATVDSTTANPGGAGGSGVIIVKEYLPSSGADLAEIYYADDHSIEPGDLVALDEAHPIIGIKKPELAESAKIIGIVSTQPGITLSEGSGPAGAKSVPVALVGRVPTKVTTEGGEIHPGDRITLSSIPGVGRKAANYEESVGIALGSYSASSTEAVGKVMVFVGRQYGIDLRAIGDALLEEWSFGTTSLSLATSTASSTSIFASASERLMNALTASISALSGALNLTIRTLGDAIYATIGIFDKVFTEELHADLVQTKELCLEDVCITKTELQALLVGISTSTPQGEDNPPPQGSEGDTQAPVISINGDNPATIAAGSVYSDAGASVSDNIDQNLQYFISVNGSSFMTPDQLVLDTSAPGTHSILYRAQDQSGNIGTAERTVHVEAASSTPVEDEGEGSGEETEPIPPVPSEAEGEPELEDPESGEGQEPTTDPEPEPEGEAPDGEEGGGESPQS